jgi:hypothetical protein
MGKRARAQVIKQRDWASIALKYADIYQRVVSVKSARLLAGLPVPATEQERQAWQESQPSESQTKI